MRKVIPKKVRYLIAGLKPKVLKHNTYILKEPKIFKKLHPIDDHFIIRELTIKDAPKLKIAYGNKNSFKSNILPRLKSDIWTGLCVINTKNNDIAYVSWVITGNTQFINEFDIYLQEKQFFMRHGFCVAEYRHNGLHTRMEQERINFCVKHDATDVFIQISVNNDKGINSVTNNGFKYYCSHNIIYISNLGVYRELKSFLKSPLKRVI